MKDNQQGSCLCYNGVMNSVLISTSKTQKEIIIGSILGDGYLEFNGCVGTRLQIKQTLKSRDYVFWLYTNFQNLCTQKPKFREDVKQWYFSTRALKELTNFHHLFYKGRKKVIPNNIFRLLVSPLSLAVWFMDDGTLDYRPNCHCSFSISTHSFSLDEARTLGNVLRKNFNVEASVNNNFIRGKRYPRIYIGKNGRDRFIELVSPFILDCFKYKLPQYRQPLRDFSRIKIEGWQV